MLNWATIAQITAVLTAVGGLCLHLMGATYNAEYYQRWGVDVAFFPLAADATLVLGYQALLNGVAEGALALYRDYRPWLYAYGVFLAVVMLLAALVGRRRSQGKHLWSPGARWRGAALLWVPAAIALAIPSLVIPYAGILGVFALVLPMSTAEGYAQQQVQVRLEAYQNGCTQPTARFRCTTISREGSIVATGFLVGASPSHVALYDPTTHKVLTLERAGLTLASQPLAATAARTK